MLADDQVAAFPRPKTVRAGGMTLQRVELEPYPFFVDVRQSGLARGHPAVAGLGGVTFPWAAPLSVQAKEGTEVTVLAHTTPRAWRYDGTELDPPEPTEARAEEVLAVAVTGRIPSAFAETPNPLLAGEAPEGGDPTVGTVKQSLPDARLAVLGAPEMVSDLVLQLAQGPGGEVHRGNLQLLQNLVDWSVEDTELLAIRSAGAFARTLAPLDDETRNLLELGQVALALALVGLVALGQRARRAAIQPIPLPEAR
jgi:ABC-2 type transport system permease protein